MSCAVGLRSPFKIWTSCPARAVFAYLPRFISSSNTTLRTLTFLELSGGAVVIAEGVLRCVGARRVPLAMLLVGYITSIPDFADSAFVMLSPLNQALTRRAGLSLAVTVTALVPGLRLGHTTVPPSPGPIAAAGIVGADLGLVLLIGVPLTLVVVLSLLYGEGVEAMGRELLQMLRRPRRGGCTYEYPQSRR